jgi:hypothetical protein
MPEPASRPRPPKRPGQLFVVWTGHRSSRSCGLPDLSLRWCPLQRVQSAFVALEERYCGLFRKWLCLPPAPEKRTNHPPDNIIAFPPGLFNVALIGMRPHRGSQKGRPGHAMDRFRIVERIHHAFAGSKAKSIRKRRTVEEPAGRKDDDRDLPTARKVFIGILLALGS